MNQAIERMKKTSPENQSKEDIEVFDRYMGFHNKPLKYDSRTYYIQSIFYASISSIFLLAMMTLVVNTTVESFQQLSEIIITDKPMSSYEVSGRTYYGVLSIIMGFGAFIFFNLYKRAKQNLLNSRMRE